jgi:hypothetical protein
MINEKNIVIIALAAAAMLFSYIHDGISAENRKAAAKAKNSDVFGIGILKRLPGQWSGPVYSSTPAGSFEKWYVDFRPVSAGQVSQYSSIDADTINYISFFIVRHGGRLAVAMRTEGVFQNRGCVTYEAADTVRESDGYYRFSDFQAGDRRAYTEFTFRGDELVMEVYTSRFNTVNPPQLHSRWSAKLAGRGAASAAARRFSFPGRAAVKDFTDTFRNMKESIYFDLDRDPYPSSSQPHTGRVTVNVAFDGKLRVRNSREVLVLLTTKSLYDGLKYDPEKLKYISRHAYLKPDAKSCVFKNVHPGKYYLYAYVDVNGDRKYLSGDFMSSEINRTFELAPNGKVTVGTKIDFVIP